MKIGDLVKLSINDPAIGIIVGKETFKNKWVIKTKYRVLWQDGNSFLHEWGCLEVIK